MNTHKILKVLNRLHAGKQPLKSTSKWILNGLEASNTIAWDCKNEKWKLYSTPIKRWV